MKNVLIITYWSFNDALIQTYTLPYVSLIRKKLSGNKKIFLVTLEQKEKKMNKKEWQKQKAKLLEQNIHLIRFSYSNFGISMILKFLFIFLYLYFLLFFNKISHIHTWCTPAGAIGYFLSIFSRKKLILDSYEPHAEPMVESGTWSKNSFKFKLLFWLEKKQLQRANYVIYCVSSMKNYIQDKFNLKIKNTFTKPACINFDLFDMNKPKSENLIKEHHLENKIVGIYIGKFEGSYLKEEVFQFIKIAEEYWGKDNFRFILLTNHSELYVQNLIKTEGINKHTIIQKFVPHNEIPNYLALANFGITPFIPVPSKRFGSPIKNSEYMSMGLPIVITENISDDSDIIEKEDIGYVLKELTTTEYNKACSHLNDMIFNQDIKNKIRKIAIKTRNFEIAQKVYEAIYS